MAAGPAQGGDRRAHPDGASGRAVAYRPVVDLQTGRLAGVEVVPGQGEDGSTQEVTLQEVAEQLQRWQGSSPDRSVFVSVNVRSLLLGPEGLPSALELLAAQGVGVEHLVLEVAEEDLASLDDETLRHLQEWGVGVCVDGFGTDHVALARLESPAVQTLKLGRDVVAGIREDWDEVPLVDSALALASALQLGAAAEGVETHAQLQYLRRRGCQQAQGDLLSPPLSAAGVEELLTEGRTWREVLGEEDACYPVDRSLTQLHEAAFSDSTLQEFVRPLLAELQRVTGMTSAYLTSVAPDRTVQHVEFTNDVPDGLVPEGAAVAWEDSLCRRSLERGIRRTVDAVSDFPDTDVAARLGITSYVAEPVYDAEGGLYGTLCGAARTSVPLTDDDSALVRLYARLITQKLRNQGSPRAHST